MADGGKIPKRHYLLNVMLSLSKHVLIKFNILLSPFDKLRVTIGELCISIYPLTQPSPQRGEGLFK